MRKIILGSLALSFGFLLNYHTAFAETDENLSFEDTELINYDLSNESKATLEDVSKSIKFYDDDGNIIPLETMGELELAPKNLIQPRATSRPTTTKYLNGTESYTSSAFTGKGERFSGYNFFTTDSNKYFKIYAYKAGFKIYGSSTASNPGNYDWVYTLYPNGSPINIELNHFVHFGVTNPVDNQYYKISKVKKF